MILLTRLEVSALQIKTLANNKIFNRAPYATARDKNMKRIRKQSESRLNKAENHTKVISSPPKRKEMMKIEVSK